MSSAMLTVVAVRIIPPATAGAASVPEMSPAITQIAST
jgi:hypothetical protein